MRKLFLFLISFCSLIAITAYAADIKILPDFDDNCYRLYRGDFLIHDSCEEAFGASITTIQGTDTLKDSRTTINDNFSALNTDKLDSYDVIGANGISWASTTYTVSLDTSSTSYSFLTGVPNVTDVGTISQLDYTNASGTALTISGPVYFSSLASCNTIDSDPSGKLACGVDASGSGGGDGFWATTSDAGLAIQADGYVVVVGAAATTTDGYDFEVVGASLFDNMVLLNASSTALTATDVWSTRGAFTNLTTTWASTTGLTATDLWTTRISGTNGTLTWASTTGVTATDLWTTRLTGTNVNTTWASTTGVTATTFWGDLTGTASGNLTSGSIDTLAELNAILLGEDVASTTATWADAYVEDNITVTGYMQDADIDTFSELDTWVTDAVLLKSGGTLDSGKICRYDGTGIDCDYTDLVGSGEGLSTSTEIVDTYIIYGTGAATVGAEAAFVYDDATDKLTVVNASGTLMTLSAGLYVGSDRWDNGSGKIDGEKIADDTIDDDSIDFADVTGVDINLTDCGDITSTGVITGDSVVANLFDVTGAADMDYGSADVTDHTFTTDDCTVIFDGGITVSTGDLIVLGSTQWNSGDEIDGTKIKDADYGDVVIDAAGDWQVSEASDLDCSDCINATEIEDIYLLDDGDAGTGVYDFGGATTFEIPNGADMHTQTSVTGQIAIDTTSDQLRYYGGSATSTLVGYNEKCFTLASTTFRNFDDIPLWQPYKAIEVISVDGSLDTANTNISVTINDGTNDMTAYVASSTSAAAAPAANATWTASERMEVDIGAPTNSGAPNWLNVCITYKYTID